MNLKKNVTEKPWIMLLENGKHQKMCYCVMAESAEAAKKKIPHGCEFVRFNPPRKETVDYRIEE